MQPYQDQAQSFKVLMHPTRLAILDILREGEQCVCHMEAYLGLRQAYISQHLMVLRDAGWVTDRREGWNIFYRVSKPEIYQVMDAMNAFSVVVGGAQAGDIRPNAKPPANQRTCPCPKCNPGAESTRYETPDLSLNKVETAA